MQQKLINKKDLDKVKEYLPNIEQEFDLDDIDELQIAIMVAIDKTFINDSEPTDETYVLEDIYDRVSAMYKKLQNV